MIFICLIFTFVYFFKLLFERESEQERRSRGGAEEEEEADSPLSTGCPTWDLILQLRVHYLSQRQMLNLKPPRGP